MSNEAVRKEEKVKEDGIVVKREENQSTTTARHQQPDASTSSHGARVDVAAATSTTTTGTFSNKKRILLEARAIARAEEQINDGESDHLATEKDAAEEVLADKKVGRLQQVRTGVKHGQAVELRPESRKAAETAYSTKTTSGGPGAVQVLVGERTNPAAGEARSMMPSNSELQPRESSQVLAETHLRMGESVPSHQIVPHSRSVATNQTPIAQALLPPTATHWHFPPLQNYHHTMVMAHGGHHAMAAFHRTGTASSQRSDANGPPGTNLMNDGVVATNQNSVTMKPTNHATVQPQRSQVAPTMGNTTTVATMKTGTAPTTAPPHTPPQLKPPPQGKPTVAATAASAAALGQTTALAAKAPTTAALNPSSRRKIVATQGSAASASGGVRSQSDPSADGGILKSAFVRRDWSEQEDNLLKERLEHLSPKEIEAVDWKALSKMILPDRDRKAIKMRWCRVLNPRLDRGPWTLEEEIVLLESHQQMGNSWTKIASRLPRRSDVDAMNRFRSLMKNRVNPEDVLTQKRAALVATKSSAGARESTKQQTEAGPGAAPGRQKIAVEEAAKPAASKSDPRSMRTSDLRPTKMPPMKRILPLQDLLPKVPMERKALEASIQDLTRYDQSDKKKFWKLEEDLALMYQLRGKTDEELSKFRWAELAKSFPNRDGQALRERYVTQLRPGRNFGEWTDEELMKLVELQRKYGNKWTKIAKEMPGRTYGDVKNKHYSLQRTIQRWSNRIGTETEEAQRKGLQWSPTNRLRPGKGRAQRKRRRSKEDECLVAEMNKFGFAVASDGDASFQSPTPPSATVNPIAVAQRKKPFLAIAKTLTLYSTAKSSSVAQLYDPVFHAFATGTHVAYNDSSDPSELATDYKFTVKVNSPMFPPANSGPAAIRFHSFLSSRDACLTENTEVMQFVRAPRQRGEGFVDETAKTVFPLYLKIACFAQKYAPPRVAICCIACRKVKNLIPNVSVYFPESNYLFGVQLMKLGKHMEICPLVTQQVKNNLVPNARSQFKGELSLKWFIEDWYCKLHKLFQHGQVEPVVTRNAEVFNALMRKEKEQDKFDRQSTSQDPGDVGDGPGKGELWESESRAWEVAQETTHKDKPYVVRKVARKTLRFQESFDRGIEQFDSMTESVKAAMHLSGNGGTLETMAASLADIHIDIDNELRTNLLGTLFAECLEPVLLRRTQHLSRYAQLFDNNASTAIVILQCKFCHGAGIDGSLKKRAVQVVPSADSTTVERHYQGFVDNLLELFYCHVPNCPHIPALAKRRFLAARIPLGTPSFGHFTRTIRVIMQSIIGWLQAQLKASGALDSSELVVSEKVHATLTLGQLRCYASEHNRLPWAQVPRLKMDTEDSFKEKAGDAVEYELLPARVDLFTKEIVHGSTSMLRSLKVRRVARAEPGSRVTMENVVDCAL